MLRSLMSGVTGVKAHQTLLDVTGNNIANVNTAGFKKSKVIFQDLLYQTNRQGSAPDEDKLGGIDSQQVGLGVKVGAIETLHTQGNTEYTGNRTDLAIQGDGYYVVTDGVEQMYTRAGNFILDADSNMAHAGTGYRLQGYSMVEDSANPGTYVPGTQLSDVTIPVGKKMEARETTLAGFRCNLDSGVPGHLPTGVLAQGFSSTATLGGKSYDISIAEGSSAETFFQINGLLGNDALGNPIPVNLALSGVNATTKLPELASDPVLLGGQMYKVAFSSTTGTLRFENLGSSSDAWELNLKPVMDYEVVTLQDGTQSYNYLAEFNDVSGSTTDGFKRLRLWGTDYRGEQSVFELPQATDGRALDIPMGKDGTFDLSSIEPENLTVGGFAGGAFISLATAAGGKGLILTSQEDIVDSDQAPFGIRPDKTSAALNGKTYDVTVREGDPATGNLLNFQFVDRANVNNTGALNFGFNGLVGGGGNVTLTSTGFTLNGRTYTAAYVPTAGAVPASMTITDTVSAETWTYTFDTNATDTTAQLNFGSATVNAAGTNFRTEYDALGGGDYRLTFLGGTTPAEEYFSVNASNFRQKTGVIPSQSTETIGTETYTVALSEDASVAAGTRAQNFVTMTFTPEGGGAPQTLHLSLAGVDSEGRVQLNPNISVASTLALGGVTFDRGSYDPSTGVLTLSDGTTSKTFDLGSSLRFGETVTSTVAAGTPRTFITEYDESGTTAFNLNLWSVVDGEALAVPGVGPFTTTVASAAVVPGSLMATIGANVYRDDGAGNLVASDGTAYATYVAATGVITWPAAAAGAAVTVDYLSAAANYPLSSVSIPVERGNDQALKPLNQRTANVHNTKFDVYDSLGMNHALEVSWEKVDSNVWRWRAWLPDDPQVSLEDNTGLIRFTPDGKIDSSNVTTYNPNPKVRIGFGEIGAREAEVTLDFSGESFGKEKIEGVTQYDSPFTTKEYNQDGYAMGILNDFSVTPDGTVKGSFTNGKNIPMFRLPLALFANPQGLDKTGDSCFREGANSGSAQVQFATEGGAGKIIGSTVEMSNVDLTDEFVTLIKGQRGFQASARVVSTGDQVLEELINLKR